MKNKLFSIILIICLLIMNTYLAHADKTIDENGVFVSINGDDSNLGTIGSPVKTLQKAKELAKQEGRTPFIYISSGKYNLTEPLELDGSDSGLSIMSYGSGEVILSGSVKLSLNEFKKTTDSNILKRLPESSVGKIYEMDLYPYIGNMTRYEGIDSSIESDFGYYELYSNNTLQTLARWPNYSEHMLVKNPLNKSLSFHANTQRALRWQTAYDMIVYGQLAVGQYWRSQVKATSVDNNGNVFLERNPMYGEIYERGYHVFNLLEELDSVGEWYIENRVGKPVLYYYPPNDLSELELSFNTGGIIKCINGVNDISIENIKFEHSRGDAVKIENASNINITQCIFTQLAHNGINISNSNNCTVSSCDFYDIGGIAVNLEGGDIYTLTPGNNLVENCDIYNCSRVYCILQESSGIRINGMGNIIKNCKLHDLPGVAIYCAGVEHLISENEIYNVTYEMDDAGAVYFANALKNWGSTIQKCYLHDLKNIGIYIDDCSHNISALGNIIEKTKKAVLCGGGRYNTLDNNIIMNNHIYYDVRGMRDQWQYAAWKVDGTYDKALDELRADPNYNEQLWCDRYSGFAEMIDDLEKQRENLDISDPGIPKKVTVINNVFVDGEMQSITPPYGLPIEYVVQNGNCEPENNYAAPASEIGFVDYENKNYNLRDDSVVFDMLRYFTPTDFSAIGLNREVNYPATELKSILLGDNMSVGMPFEIAWTDLKTEYNLVIARNAELSDIVLSETLQKSYKELNGLENGTYYWRVSCDGQSSDTYSFTVVSNEDVGNFSGNVIELKFDEENDVRGFINYGEKEGLFLTVTSIDEAIGDRVDIAYDSLANKGTGGKALRLTKGSNPLKTTALMLETNIPKNFRGKEVILSYDLRVENLTDDHSLVGGKRLYGFPTVYDENYNKIMSYKTYHPFLSLNHLVNVGTYRTYKESGVNQRDLSDKYYTFTNTLNVQDRTLNYSASGVGEFDEIENIKFICNSSSAVKKIVFCIVDFYDAEIGDNAVVWIDNLRIENSDNGASCKLDFEKDSSIITRYGDSDGISIDVTDFNPHFDKLEIAYDEKANDGAGGKALKLTKTAFNNGKTNLNIDFKLPKGIEYNQIILSYDLRVQEINDRKSRFVNFPSVYGVDGNPILTVSQVLNELKITGAEKTKQLIKLENEGDKYQHVTIMINFYDKTIEYRCNGETFATSGIDKFISENETAFGKMTFTLNNSANVEGEPTIVWIDKLRAEYK